MLRVCTAQEYEAYLDWAYALAMNPAQSGYPAYYDGIKTKEMFVERAQMAFSRDTEELLLFEYEGRVEGWLHYYWLPEDRYLSTVSFNIADHTAEALREFLDWTSARFAGYDLFLGYGKENAAAIEFLSAQGFERIEEDVNTTCLLTECEPGHAGDDVVRVDREGYEAFRRLHAEQQREMYWNCDRIYADLDNWIIFAKLRDGETLGAAYYMIDDDGWFEIYGIDMKDGAFDPALLEELLQASLSEAKRIGGRYMTYFCENEEWNVAGRLGFERVGEYVCYKKRIA